MGKKVIIYGSKYGTTEKYAKWIAAATGAELMKYKEASIEKLQKYDTIIYGGGLYGTRILGFKALKKSYGELKNKKIVVFAVGASRESREVIARIKAINFTDEMKHNIQLFYLRGGLNYPAMSTKDRLLMLMLKVSIKVRKEEKRDADMNSILATYGKKVDFTQRSAIQPIIKYLK